ncbi:gamma-glutamylcyclotransferase family protein [Brevibacillus sp. TJ4]|uniref:gamma-glutamylcyclotransferase family protein n=1 Tax=Brevibacillus sp. TJ4 TaxID=3234853 RepID=UPI0037D57C87
MEKKLPIFVYGTLLGGWGNYAQYVQPYKHEVVPAEISGVVYHLPMGYPGLLPGSGQVRGNLLFFAPDDYDRALSGLDELETYYGPKDRRNEYERVAATARTASGEEVEAYVYVYVDEHYVKAEGTLVADGDWQRFMRERQPE